MKKIFFIILFSLSVLLYVNNTKTYSVFTITLIQKSTHDFKIMSKEFIDESNKKIIELDKLKLEKELEEKVKREKELEKEFEEKIRKENVSFNEDNILIKSNMLEDELYQILPDTMKHLSNSIIKAEDEYSVNAFVLSSIIALESSWGTSTRAINSNNLTGMAVYGDDSPGVYYNSQDECVIDTARQLKENYLSEDGIFFEGYSTYSVNIRYCESSNWYIKVNKIAYELLEKYDRIYYETGE